MGFISNLFEQDQFEEYRELENMILEAGEDDNEDPNQNFDMPDDEEGGDNPQPANTDNVETPATPDAGGDEGEDFNMPDDAGGEPEQADPQEVPADNTAGNEPAPANNEAPAPDQGGEDENFDMPDDAGGDAPAEPGTDPAGGEDTGGGDEDNFNLPDDAGGEGDNPEGGNDAAGQNNSAGGGTASNDVDDSGMNSATGEDPNQEIKDAENDIYDNLSDQDKANKDRELKDLYEELYNRIDELYNKINDIPKEEDLIKVYDFVMNNLSDLKQFVYDYLNNSFNSKPYLQNMVNYKKYLSTLNIINGILEEIRKGSYTDK